MEKNKTGKHVNVAVAGLGFMGVTHLRGYLQIPNARIVAVCDPVRLPVNGVLAGVAGNIARSGDLKLEPDVNVYKDVAQMLANPAVELVDLCTPTPDHPGQTIACLKAGKHVLCEKPLARTSAGVAGILSVAKTAEGFLMPAMCMRFWPGWSWLKESIQSGRFGKVLAASFRRVSEMPNWSREGTYKPGADTGGALFDLHIHDTDFVHYLFGTPQKVFSRGVLGASGTIDHVQTQYIFDSGPSVIAEGSWLLQRGFQMSYTLHCERATLDFDSQRGPKAMQVTEAGQEPTYPTYAEPDGYTAELRYMIDSIAQDTRPAVVTAQDALSVLQICEAEERSLLAGQVVVV